MNPIELYANRLKHCLVVNAGMNTNQVQTLVSRFYEAIAAQTSPELAFRGIIENYGNESAEAAVRSVQNELERLNREHAGIDSNPVTRLRRYVKQFNANVGKLDIEVSGIDESKLSDYQRTQLEIARQDRKHIALKLPKSLAQEEAFVALADHRGKPVKLELTIRY
jgi:predicted nuclease with TOPRIM domain